MFDPLRKIMLRFDPHWDTHSVFRKYERYMVLLLYVILTILFAIIMLKA
jgi:hypothetical protein